MRIFCVPFYLLYKRMVKGAMALRVPGVLVTSLAGHHVRPLLLAAAFVLAILQCFR